MTKNDAEIEWENLQKRVNKIDERNENIGVNIFNAELIIKKIFN